MKGKSKYNLRSDSKKFHGATAPGYNYLGPFNSLENGPPVNLSDAAAKEHDIKYGVLGKRAYYTYNKADEEFLKAIDKETDWGAKIAKRVFNAKKKLAQWGVLPQDMGEGDFVTPENQKPKAQSTKISPGKKSKRSLEYEIDLAGNLVSFSNLPPSKKAEIQRTTMSDGTGSGNQGGLKETPIDDVTDIVQRGPSNYTFASLPFLRQSNVEQTRYMDQMLYRMTSPYDCVVDTTTTDANAGTGVTNMEVSKTDANDTTISKARWYDFYAGMYKYYHVVACRWHLTLENQGDAPIWVHQWYQNETDRPTGAGNLDMLGWQDTYSHYVDCQHIAIETGGNQERTQGQTGGNAPSTAAPANSNFEAQNNVSKQTRASPILQISGEYRPGDYEREIRQDVNVENWTSVTTNPLLAERLCFRIRPWSDSLQKNSATSTQDGLKYTYFIRLEYLVEFKELQPTLRYPVQHQPLTVTVQNNEETE